MHAMHALGHSEAAQGFPKSVCTQKVPTLGRAHVALEYRLADVTMLLQRGAGKPHPPRSMRLPARREEEGDKDGLVWALAHLPRHQSELPA